MADDWLTGASGTTTGTVTEITQKDGGGVKAKVGTDDGKSLTLHFGANKAKPSMNDRLEARWTERKPSTWTDRSFMKFVDDWKPASGSRETSGGGADPKMMLLTLAAEPVVAACAKGGRSTFTDDDVAAIVANFRVLEGLVADLNSPPAVEPEPEPPSGDGW